ncbi:MAG: O-antigen ligase family protein [Anaerolineae bacterium]|nr:O-antigen ligase family protein [Anaerolineae bacterium]
MYPPSRLALFSEKFIQACWLIALIIAPLYFNIYSSRVFEPDKITLIRTLALAMGAMWLILRSERRRGGRPTRANVLPPLQRARAWLASVSEENPLTIPVALLFAAYVLSTLLSLSPTVSFFGSYQRLQGLYTFSAYLVIFFLAASRIKTRADVERAITIALVASFPVAFYAIIQHYYLDPLPWVGDVTTRVASSLGNSIFIGAFLILTIPLALARLLQTGKRAAVRTARPPLVYLAAVVTFLGMAAIWGLTFDLGAKSIIESNYSGIVTPEQLNLASGAFNLALLLSFAVILLWWGAAFVFKQRAADFLLPALYASLLAVQFIALLFTQSRGPLLGILGGLFTFGVLLALVRGARKLALGAVGAAALLFVFLALLNIPDSPFASLRQLPYFGRMGRVFELEGGTGRVRVLIWQGALQLVVLHEPLWSPVNGDDPFNALRPLVGYGPETMYVSYNRYYPPELGNLESRNATPDRSHNETFDALVTTGLLGFVAENILFLVVLYLAMKWLGLMPSLRARNLFLGLWFGGGLLLAAVFGLVFGWEFIGVALPGGMILGMFVYLVAVALRAGPFSLTRSPNALWLVALVALFVAHFIEIHFGIAIVSSRLYFWFFAAVFVVIGTGRVQMGADTESAPPIENKPTAEPAPAAAVGKRKRVSAVTAPTAKSKSESAPRRVSSAPLILYAFLVGFVLAVMGYDYITTNNLGTAGGQAVSGLSVVISALTGKNTTTGLMTSYTMLWLFVTTLLVGLGICASEWGHTFRLGARDWFVACILFVVLAFAIFSGLVFYHVLLIATVGATVLDALLTAVILFSVFTLLVAVMCAITMLFDETLPAAWVNRTTNYVVAPVLAIVAFLLIFATNIEPIRADMLYKQAASLTGENTATAVQLFQRALAMQPQQDYYDLFLGRAYLDQAKSATDVAAQMDALDRAQEALLRARAINPYNTDHSANLARLAQARGALSNDPAVKIDAYKQAMVYFDHAHRLSPNTAHLYNQHAQALLEYSQVLADQGNIQEADAERERAHELIFHSLQVDPTFCFTFAVRAQAETHWRERTMDALDAIRYAPQCGDVFRPEGLGLAVSELTRAADEAIAATEAARFETLLTQAAVSNPTLETYTVLANFYSKLGRVPDAITAIDSALTNIPASDSTTRQRYQDFRFTLVELNKALEAASASPTDPALATEVARQWLARGQPGFALPAYQKVAALKPDDYAAQRNIALLLIATDQLSSVAQQIALAQQLAPDADKTFWAQLNTVVTEIQSGKTEQASSQLKELLRGANAQDFALVSALRKLAEKLGGAG